jgi:hypothetical protein
MTGDYPATKSDDYDHDDDDDDDNDDDVDIFLKPYKKP